tara:strand:- start:955 stop:1086 length:132 start_codon:yes stop_codon:yes gene_type:complete
MSWKNKARRKKEVRTEKHAIIKLTCASAVFTYNITEEAILKVQ